MEWPDCHDVGRARGASTTARTSSTMPFPGEVLDAGEVLSPWPRKSMRPAVSHIGQVGGQRLPDHRRGTRWRGRTASGGPSPPWSCSASVTPSVEGTWRHAGAGRRHAGSDPARWPNRWSRRRRADRVGGRCRKRSTSRRSWPANRGFYDAFEARDLDAMSDVWEHDDTVVCTHPGWRTLHGWGAVAGSWFALFGGPSTCSSSSPTSACIWPASRLGDRRREPDQRAGRRHGGGRQHVPPASTAAGAWCCTTARRWRPPLPSNLQG